VVATLLALEVVVVGAEEAVAAEAVATLVAESAALDVAAVFEMLLAGLPIVPVIFETVVAVLPPLVAAWATPVETGWVTGLPGLTDLVGGVGLPDLVPVEPPPPPLEPDPVPDPDPELEPEPEPLVVVEVGVVVVGVLPDVGVVVREPGRVESEPEREPGELRRPVPFLPAEPCDEPPPVVPLNARASLRASATCWAPDTTVTAATGTPAVPRRWPAAPAEECAVRNCVAGELAPSSFGHPLNATMALPRMNSIEAAKTRVPAVPNPAR
jgi:hypothetical protein